MLNRLAAAVLVALCSHAAAQDVTGNLIYTTTNPPPPGAAYSWSGFILTESGGGGLWGGDVPAYNPSVGQFMWGYMPGTINYSMAVNSALQGTGLRITGIQYGLEYWNQDLSRGSLSTTITLRDTSNNILQSYYHSLGYTTEGWTKFDMTKTFSTPYSLASVGSLNLSATGSDDRFWAGYYGPQIRNPYARLEYGVDPCETNPLSSATCAGFADAMARLKPPAVTTEPLATTATVTVDPVATAQPTVTEIAAAASPTVATVANPVPSAVPTATRSAATNNSAAVSVARRAVSEAQATVNSVLSQAQESAAASQGGESSGSSDSSTTVGSSALGSGLTMSFGFQVPGTFSVPGTAMNFGTSSVNSSAQGPAESTDQTASETSPTSTRSLAAMSNARAGMPEETTAAPGTSTVRNVAPPAELAGGPDIGSMAVAPQGFNSYLTAQIRDVAFYPPREVYRGQRTVDNVRALRGLGSDARHAEMVDQQYRK